MKYDSGFKADKIVGRILKLTSAIELTSVKVASLPPVLSAKWTSLSRLQRFSGTAQTSAVSALLLVNKPDPPPPKSSNESLFAINSNHARQRELMGSGHSYSVSATVVTFDF